MPGKAKGTQGTVTQSKRHQTQYTPGMIKPEITMEYWTCVMRIDSPTNRKKNTTPTQIIIHFF